MGCSVTFATTSTMRSAQSVHPAAVRVICPTSSIAPVARTATCCIFLTNPWLSWINPDKSPSSRETCLSIEFTRALNAVEARQLLFGLCEVLVESGLQFLGICRLRQLRQGLDDLAFAAVHVLKLIQVKVSQRHDLYLTYLLN